MKTHKPLRWIGKNCRFPVFAGEHLAHKPVGRYLLPFQQKIIKQVLGPEGEIKKSCFIIGCRKVSKTFLYSMILWYLLNNRKGFQAPIMAYIQNQAFLVRNQLLQQKYDKKDISFFKEIILNKKTGARLDFMSNSPGSVLGLESDGLVADEIGAYKSSDTLLNLSTGGSLSPQKFLKLFSSNPPMTDDHFVFELAKQAENDDNFVVHRFTLSAKKDWTCEKNWAEANPFLQEYFESGGKRFAYVMDFYRDYFNNAVQSKNLEYAFRRYLLGQFISGDSSFIPLEKIKIVNESIFKEKNIRWAVGLDYSITHDFTSASLVGWRQGTNKVYLQNFMYLPNMNKRHDIQKRQFTQWEKAGYISIQNSEVLQGDQVSNDVISYLVENKITPEAIIFDKAIGAHHTEAFKQFKCIDIRMTPREMTTSIRELERSGNGSGLHFVGENPALKWMFDNVVVSSKSKNYCMLDRLSPRQNIDGVVSACLGLKYLVENKKMYPIIMAV